MVGAHQRTCADLYGPVPINVTSTATSTTNCALPKALSLPSSQSPTPPLAHQLVSPGVGNASLCTVKRTNSHFPRL